MTNHITLLHIEAFKHDKLTIENWQLYQGQTFCILGKNGAGKQYLNRLITGEITAGTAKKLVLPSPNDVALISFEAMQQVYEHELKIDETDITNEFDDGTLARDFLPQNQWAHPLINRFGLTHRLDTGYRLLSTGESRKLLLLQAILNSIEEQRPILLVCDNPFDSLDQASCDDLSELLGQLAAYKITVIISLSNRQDIPKWCGEIALIDKGKLVQLGDHKSPEVQRHIDSFMRPKADDTPWPQGDGPVKPYPHDFIVKLQQGHVKYQNAIIFEHLDLSILPLQHTLVTGKNGCGKSSLLQLITGDHPQCYVNDIEVLGFKRGNGESIWQVKQNMGIVSPEIHRQYRVSCSVLTVVLSGFYDSIGLYVEPTAQQIALAQQWLNKVGLIDYQQLNFSALSYGEQRIVLILRALVKRPHLLVMDEATQGLDELNRYRVLRFLEQLETMDHTTIFYVSHRSDEYLSLFKQHLQM